MFWLILVVSLFSSSEQRSLSLTDLQTLVDTIGDELVTHQKLPSAASIPEAIVSQLIQPSIYIAFFPSICQTICPYLPLVVAGKKDLQPQNPQFF